MIAVISAHRDGKEIEYRHHSNDSEWKPVARNDYGFTFMSFEYRIKALPPKPRGGLIRVTGERTQEYLRCPACDAMLIYALNLPFPGAPQPREWWIAHTPEINPDLSPAYPKKPEWTPVNPLKTEIIHVIEVLPSSGESA